MIKALEQRLGIDVEVPIGCEYVCALGAALLGLKRLQSRDDIPLEVSHPTYQFEPVTTV